MDRDGWRHRIYLGDIFGDPTMEFPARRDEITRRIKRAWFNIEATANGDPEISEITYQLLMVRSEEDFELVWQRFYAWADQHGVLVETDPGED